MQTQGSGGTCKKTKTKKKGKKPKEKALSAEGEQDSNKITVKKQPEEGKRGFIKVAHTGTLQGQPTTTFTMSAKMERRIKIDVQERGVEKATRHYPPKYFVEEPKGGGCLGGQKKLPRPAGRKGWGGSLPGQQEFPA